MTDQYHCTYCGTALGAVADHSAGETLHCADCGVEFDLVAEDDMYDLAAFPCPYCGHDNKRSQSVSEIRCDNADCDLVYDPAGVTATAPDPDTLRVKMQPRTGGS